MSLLDPTEQNAAENAVEGGVAPAGVYLCRVHAVEKWKTGSSLRWIYKVVPEQLFAGKEFWEFTGLKDASIWRTKARMASLGQKIDATEDQIIGIPVAVTVEVGVRQDNGEPRNNVTNVTLYEGELPAEPDSNPDSDLDAVFGAPPEGLI